MSRVAFIGLGAMGAPMAANLVKGGREVIAFDLVPAAVERAVAVGCKPAGAIAQAVAEAEVVITMLPAGPQVLEVLSQEVLPNARSGALLIDCSTIAVEAARAAAVLAVGAGFRFADAPVSGGMVGAQAGTLTFMVGCGEDDFPAVAEALKPMAKTAIYAGTAGAGQAAKICNNMLLGISMLGTCEAFSLAEKLGLDGDRFFEISSQSSGQCWSLSVNCPIAGPVPTSPANRGYVPGFTTAMMLKDLKLAQAAAASAGATTPMGAEAEALFALFDGLGYGGRDFSAVIQLLRGRLSELA